MAGGCAVWGIPEGLWGVRDPRGSGDVGGPWQRREPQGSGWGSPHRGQPGGVGRAGGSPWGREAGEDGARSGCRSAGVRGHW